MTVKEKQHSGALYHPFDPDILKEQLRFLDELKEYNEIPHVCLEKREEKLRSMSAILTASIGMDPKKVFLFLRLLHSFLRIGAGNVIERLTEPDTLE